MTQLEGIALLLVLCAGMLLSGYWLAALLDGVTTVAERLAVALLAGVGVLLLLVSGLNYFLPLAWPQAGVCLIPLLVSVGLGRCRRRLWADLGAFFRDRETRMAGLLLGVFLALLLAALLLDGRLLFYDPTPNHDSFFWVAAAEHLKLHTYLEPAQYTATQPLFAATNAIIGIKPAWGRMGAEGMLALTATLALTSPLKVYLYATAALFLPWVGGVYLTAKTFFEEKLTRTALVGLALLQPLFLFYYGNANLPNLLGALSGAGAVLATERAARLPLRPAGAFFGWALLLVLSLHGLYCSYPEMIPFVGLSCGLLWLRPWFSNRYPGRWRAALLLLVAVGASLAVNPATTLRAWNGFFAVLGIARANTNYANIFQLLEWSEFLPALVTLVIPAASRLPIWTSIPLTAAMAGCLAAVFWRARDRFGAVAIFAGSIALAAYTLATGFAYGWQKTVQFSGIFIATALPVMVFDFLARRLHDPGSRRWVARGALAAIAAFMSYATILAWLDMQKWSERKALSRDWVNLRTWTRGALQDQPVLVDGVTFRSSFFHGMWTTYFLSGSHLYFAARGEQNGGYLRDFVVSEQKQPIPPPAAILMGREWADAFEANTYSIAVGREYRMLRQSNRVWRLTGVSPEYGLPERAGRRIELELTPHSPSRLSLVLRLRRPNRPDSGEWQVVRRTDGVADFHQRLATPPPWRIGVPLTAGQVNRIEIKFTGPEVPRDDIPFVIEGLRLEDWKGGEEAPNQG